MAMVTPDSMDYLAELPTLAEWVDEGFVLDTFLEADHLVDDHWLHTCGRELVISEYGAWDMELGPRSYALVCCYGCGRIWETGEPIGMYGHSVSYYVRAAQRGSHE